MRIHYIIHAEFEKPGAIDIWAQHKKYSTAQTHTYKHEKLPNPDDFDFLIVMGGPQSPLHLDKWPYLQDEINLIKKTIEANKPIFGICLGAQLIAESLGAKTERSPNREIGLFPLTLLADAVKDPVFSQFPQSFNAMHWHNDMPGLPQNARLLAKSAGCPRQAFSIGDRVYGLQCHLELTQDNIVEMIEHCKKELTPDLYVDSEEKLRNHELSDVHEKLFVLLDYLSSKISK